jgi:chaperonin GroES
MIKILLPFCCLFTFYDISLSDKGPPLQFILIHYILNNTSIIFSPKGGECMKLRPLADRVVIKRIEEEEVKKGGIIIPDTAKEKPQKGEVIAVGPGRLDEKGNRIPLEVKVGDKVLFSKYAGTEVKVGDEEYLVMREDDILCIIEG